MKEKRPAKRVKTMKVNGVRRGSPPFLDGVTKQDLDAVKRHVRGTGVHFHAEAGRSRGLVNGRKTSTKLKSGKRKKK